tara:strand:+ start:251 stop:601 length:351 start_codon:yes stop_codon:yes gene_type:complete
MTKKKYKAVPSFEDWIKLECKNFPILQSELREQYKTVYGILSMKLPSCFVNGVQHSMFEVASLNGMKFEQVGLSTTFECPFTGRKMRIHNSFFGGPPMWVPKKVALNSPEVINNIK